VTALGYFSLGATFGFAAAVQPGPTQTFLASQAVANGWRRTLPAALAPLVSDVPIAFVALVVLSRMPPWLLRSLRAAGGVFLLYLAYGAYRTWREHDATAAAATDFSGGKTLAQATVVNLLNPNPYLGWSLVLGPLVLEGWSAGPASGLAAVAGFYLAMLASLAAIVVLFAAARTLGARVNRVLIGLAAIGLAGFGAWQLVLAAVEAGR